MIRLELAEAKDAVRIVDALHVAAAECAVSRPFLARRYTLLADQVGDAIDQSGLPVWSPDLLDLKKSHTPGERS